MYVIWSYSHKAWWGPERLGYVDELENAGEYSASAAGEIVTGSLMLTTIAIHKGTLKFEYNNEPPKFHPYRGETDAED